MFTDRISKTAKKELEKHAEDGLWNPEYVTYDAQGVKEVACMRCGTPVMKRPEAEAKCPHCRNQFMIEMPVPVPLPNCARVKHELPSGSYVELILCADCSPIVQKMEREEAQRVYSQIESAAAIEMEKVGKPAEAIEDELSRIRERTALKEETIKPIEKEK